MSDFAKDANVSTNDCISRQAAVDALADMHCKSDEDGYVWIIRSDAWARIDALPSAQSKKGRWISADAIFGGIPFYCSECGENTRDTVMGKPRWKFCPMCGSYNGGET